MDSKQAVAIAKRWVADQFEPEHIAGIGLEELKFERGRWLVTIGFFRPAFDRGEKLASFLDLNVPRFEDRIYKIIVVNDASGEVIEMQNREAA